MSIPERDNIHKSNRRRKLIKTSIVLIAALVILMTVSAGAAYMMSYKPDAVSIAEIGSKNCSVTRDGGMIILLPEDIKPKTGFIFYPGGLVAPESYEPLCEKIAKNGYLVVIVPMSCNLAILSPDRADRAISRFPEIRNWAIGGHSLGGVMACRYAGKHSEIKGVALYASYPQKDELAGSSCCVVSIYGSKDGVADINKIRNADLPADAEFLEIEGGNHCQFGSYGMQKGDNTADITAESQQDIAAEATVKMLKGMDN